MDLFWNCFGNALEYFVILWECFEIYRSFLTIYILYIKLKNFLSTNTNKRAGWNRRAGGNFFPKLINVQTKMGGFFFSKLIKVQARLFGTLEYIKITLHTISKHIVMLHSLFEQKGFEKGLGRNISSTRNQALRAWFYSICAPS